MSAGAKATIREIMEYMGEQNQQQIDDAQMKVLDTAKTLEAEGKISSYRRSDAGGVYILDSSDVSQSSLRESKMGKAAQSQNLNASAEDYFNSAVELYNSGNYEEAASYFKYITDSDPNNASAWQYLGSSYYSLGNYQEAVSAYENYVNITGDEEFRSWLEDLKRQLGM
jgi:tetratricopeptide (TPR) repeat protein